MKTNNENTITLGSEIIDLLQTGRKDKTLNNKDSSFSIIIQNDDIKLLDDIAILFDVKRSYILNLIITSEISSMFEALPIKEKYQLADYIDAKITKKNLKHSFNNQTWMHEVKSIPDSAFNPSNQSIFDNKKEEV